MFKLQKIYFSKFRSYTTKLLISNLSPLTTQESLHGAFYNYGDLKSVKVKPFNNFQKSLPYAIIDYTTAEEAQKAIESLPNHTLNKHPINCSTPKTTVYDWKLVGRDHRTKVYVRSRGMNQDKLMLLAEAYGNVKGMIVRFPVQKKRTGTGMVEFERQIDADRAAVGLNCSELDGNFIQIQKYII
ncbi:hypothetical protein HDV01_006895 [Terramyces sp. JEL0728]|nr:hypothetical protein HDV01_006895 [Terramyces sp. JEL0728]